MKLVIYPPVEPERLEKITAAGGPMTVVNAANDNEALREIADADAFFGKLSPPLLSAAQKLRWVQSPTASLEHYIFPELVKHDCVLTNMRGLFSDVIANQVFGYIICFARNMHIYIRRQKEARYEPVGGEQGRSSFAAGPGTLTPMYTAHKDLGGATLGIVGLGHIGAEIAMRGLAFGMRVIAVDPLRTEAPSGIDELWKPNRLKALLAQSDYVVIAAPHTPDTEKLFRRKQFQQMKPSAFLINIGRGVIVDLTDLTAALKAGEIAGAGLDVFETEPLPPDHPLWQMENVVITPHVAGYSPRIPERHLAVLLDNIGRFVNGQKLRNLVNKKMWF